MKNETPRIAIIDSGINPTHSHVGEVEGGLSFVCASNGRGITSGDFKDEIGHGTAIAGVIKGKCPGARLYAVKIFQKALSAPATLLLASLRWSIENNFKLIHLSLGTEREQYRDELERLCRSACEASLIVVASARGPADVVYPACFETVIGTYWNQECDEHSLAYHPRAAVKFGAYGLPRPLPYLPQEMNFRGHSFAAAHVTGRVAALLEENPHGDVVWVKEKLAETALVQDQ